LNANDPQNLGSGDGSSLSKWFSYKRKRFWILFLVLLYTLLGFFLLPTLINKLVIDAAHDKLGREASFEKIQVNPYALSLRTTGFELKDSDGEILIAYDEVFVNLQLSSLFQWAWVFSEVHIKDPFFQLERFTPEDSRLSRLLSDITDHANTDNGRDEVESAGLPRLLVQDLSINNATLDFRDHVPESLLELHIGPATVSIQELNTLPDRYGQQSVTVKLPDDATLRWQGNISLAPLESEGELILEGSHLDQTIAYLQAFLPLDSIAATLSVHTAYRLNAMNDGGLDIELNALELELADVSIIGLESSSPLLLLPEFSLQGGSLEYPEKVLKFSSVQVRNPQVSSWLNENGSLNLLDLMPQPGDPTSTGDATRTPSPSWKVAIDKFILEGGDIAFSDRSITPHAEVNVTELHLAVNNISNEAERSMPVSLAGAFDAGGDFKFEGEVTAIPGFRINGQSQIRDIPLDLGQPYVQQKFNLLIESGTFSSQTEIAVQAPDTFDFTGNLISTNLKIRDTKENQDLVAWDKLEIDRFELDLPTRILQLSIVQFEHLYGRLKVNQDRSTNLAGLLISKDPLDEDQDRADSPAWSAIIGATGVSNGSLDFSDLSLPLHFEAHITDMDGTISTIDTASSEPANIRLEGQVNEFGLARIEGSMNVLSPIDHTDVSVEFRNLLMSNYSPYSAQFAGREIDEGKLNLNLGYLIEQGSLQAQNKIVLSDLVLGAKVDHPDAANLPLGLAVSLLKDADGVIDIDFPVEGDINDPQFQLSGVVMKAIVGLITKVVSAPFRLLGSLIGIDSDDFGQFQFLAGRSDLTPPELEKIAQLQQALQQRPELSIEISGPYDAEVDRPKLQYFSLRDTVMERLGLDVEDQEGDFEMVDDAIRTVFESLFVAQFPATPLETLKASHMKPPAGDPNGEPELDELAYSADLRDRLLAAESIDSEDLEELANERALAIRSAFLSNGDFSENRIRVAEPASTESTDGEWVVTELKVADLR
jgi:hypothetical protein